MRLLHGLGTQRVIVEAVEVTLEGEIVLCPDPLECLNEFVRAAIAFVVFEPRFAERGEFTLEPAAHHVDPNTAIRYMVDCGQLFGDNGGVPRTWQNRRQHPE